MDALLADGRNDVRDPPAMATPLKVMRPTLSAPRPVYQAMN